MSQKTGGKKVVVIGAGQVGASVAYCAAIQQLCSELVLVDVNQEKAEGEAMDIAHGLPFLGEMDIYAGGYESVKDADLIIITAGAARKPGETRLDLAAKNCRIAKSMTESIMAHYNGGVLLVVANPVDILTLKIQQWSGLPRERVIGSGTALDTIRFRYLLGKTLDVDVTNVHAYILGEHGDTQFPLWSKVGIGGISLDEYLEASGQTLDSETRARIAHETKTAGAEINKRKGATFNGVAVSTCTIAKSILRDSSTIRPVGCVLQGEFGLHDVVISVPAVLSKHGIERILPFGIEGEEKEALLRSAQKMKDTVIEIGEIN